MASRIGNRIEEYKTSLGRLAPRERMALAGLGVAVVLVAALGVGYVVYSGLEDLSEQNDAIRGALKDLRTHGAEFVKQRRRMAALEVRMARTPLELNSFLEKAAKKVEVEISESAEVAAVEVDRYVQRGLEVKLRKVSIEQLSKLIKELENSPHIVQITRLSVNTRWKEHEELDVEMVVTTYDRRKEGAGEPEDPGLQGRKRP